MTTDSRRGVWAVVLASALLAAGVFVLVSRNLTDDAYITLSYAKNLAVHGQWGMVPGMQANSATSPLNVLLLGALTAASRVTGQPHPVVALGVLTVATGAVLGWAWTRLARAYRFPLPVAFLGVAVVLVNPFVLSAVGLEVLLIPTVSLLLTVFAVERRPVLFGVTAGLAILVRLDLAVFVLLIAVLTAAIRHRAGRAALAAVAVAAPWYVFSWVVLGSALPDTLVIKQEQDGLFGQWTYATGPAMYYLGRGFAVAMAFGPALVGLLAWCASLGLRFARRWTDFPPVAAPVGLGAGAIAYYVVYSSLGVGPYHWYFVAPITALGMFAVLAFGVWLARARADGPLLARAPATGLVVVTAFVLGGAAVDAGQGLPWRSPVIFGNWASAHDYARVGRALDERLADGETVRSPGEIGTLAYHCECPILDVFSDRGRAVELVRERIAESGPLGSALLRLNYLFLDRDIEPRPVDYRLRYTEGPGDGPRTWQVYSAAVGVGHFTLVPEPDPHPARHRVR